MSSISEEIKLQVSFVIMTYRLVHANSFWLGNICTAQALLANMASFYACYHGPDGLKDIANRIHNMASTAASILSESGKYKVQTQAFFDTFTVKTSNAIEIYKNSAKLGQCQWEWISNLH